MSRALAVAVLVLAAGGTLAASAEDDPSILESTGSTRVMMFLAEDRPVFLRLNITTGDHRPFEEGWPGSVRAILETLDRDGDDKLSGKELDKDALAGIVRLATGGAATLSPDDLNQLPKEGGVTAENLAGALRASLGPFRMRIGQRVAGRTDALFDQLDRDKDGVLTRRELGAIAGSLRRLDLNDDEMISAEELEPFNNPVAMALAENASERRAKYSAAPPVVELIAGESSLRPARLLLKKYDKGRENAPGRPDGKLALSEFAIEPDKFADADTNKDGALNTEELRRYLAGDPIDLAINLSFPANGMDKPTIQVATGSAMPEGMDTRRLVDGDVEFAVGRVRLDLHVDGGESTAGSVRNGVSRRFKAADANKDGYLDSKELAGFNAPGSPLAGLTGVIDRDGDGKLYAKELDAFIDRQLEAARSRLVVTTSDLGRALFSVLDLDRDRRLGAREVMMTLDRVMSWDADKDDQIAAEEIPYHFRVNIARGDLDGLAPVAIPEFAIQNMRAASPGVPTTGPEWFRKMDRNRDGDVSRREFLGPREVFNRLDRDSNGLIDPEEAGR